MLQPARAASEISKLTGETTKVGKFFASTASRLSRLSTKHDDIAKQLDGLRSGNHSDIHNNVPRAERGEDRWQQKAAERAEAGNGPGAQRAKRKADRFAEDGERAWDRIRERSRDMRTQARAAAPGGTGTEAAKAANKDYGDGQRKPGESPSQRDDLRNPADDIGTLDE